MIPAEQFTRSTRVWSTLFLFFCGKFCSEQYITLESIQSPCAAPTKTVFSNCLLRPEAAKGVARSLRTAVAKIPASHGPPSPPLPLLSKVDCSPLRSFTVKLNLQTGSTVLHSSARPEHHQNSGRRRQPKRIPPLGIQGARVIPRVPVASTTLFPAFGFWLAARCALERDGLGIRSASLRDVRQSVQASYTLLRMVH